MAYQYDKEFNVTYEGEMFNAEDVAKNGETATFVKFEVVDSYDSDKIGRKVKELGFDTFEIVQIIHTTRRYSVEN